VTQTDKSLGKEVRASLAKDFPILEPMLDELIPKKAVTYTMRLKDNDKADLFIIDGTVLAFRRHKRWFPTLKLVHKCCLNRPVVFQDLPSGQGSN